MQMPQPTEMHKKLEMMIGSWSGTERVFPTPWDPQGGTARGRVRNRGSLDGFVVVQDYEQERSGVPNFSGHGVFCWDAAAQRYVLHWFDSMGMPPSQFVGTLEANVLSLTSQTPQGFSRASFEFSADDRYVFRIDVSGDGQQWQPFMEGTYTRES